MSIQEKYPNSNPQGDTHESFSKIKAFFTSEESFFAMLLILVAVISFGLGQMSMRTTVSETPQEASSVEVSTSVQSEKQVYVASRNGTKYHLPWCSGAMRISEQNKLFFDSKEAAESAGYTPAANCKGI